MFAKRKDKLPPFYINRRIYSCILINNKMPHRWRGRYNEDTDLSLRVLKDGWCTILFLAFLAFKETTMTIAGGNTEDLYREDGRLKMAQSLVDQHPDIVKVSWKFNRYQHHVDYSPFKNNKLIKKEDLVIPKGINNYGMKLIELDNLNKLIKREEIRDEKENIEIEDVHLRIPIENQNQLSLF